MIKNNDSICLTSMTFIRENQMRRKSLLLKRRGVANESDRTAVLKAKLQALLSEHRDLDDVIAQLTGASASDPLQMKRLKKRKLALKDEIARLHALVLPDIIA